MKKTIILIMLLLVLPLATALQITQAGTIDQAGQSLGYKLQDKYEHDSLSMCYYGARNFYVDFEQPMKVTSAICQCEQTSKDFYHYGGELECHKTMVFNTGFTAQCRSKTNRHFTTEEGNLYNPKNVFMDWIAVGEIRSSTRFK